MANDVEKLYNAVKTGKIKPGDLNEEGKKALRSYIESKGTTTTPEVKTTKPVETPKLKEESIYTRLDRKLGGLLPFGAPRKIVNEEKAFNPQEFNKSMDKFYSGPVGSFYKPEVLYGDMAPIVRPEPKTATEVKKLYEESKSTLAKEMIAAALPEAKIVPGVVKSVLRSGKSKKATEPIKQLALPPGKERLALPKTNIAGEIPSYTGGPMSAEGYSPPRSLPMTQEEVISRKYAQNLGLDLPLNTQKKAQVDFARLMDDLKQPIIERTVPPVESKRQLINFIYEGMNKEISKSEISRLDYPNLIDMAEHVAKQKTNPWELAIKEASKRDIDLDTLHKIAIDPEQARWSEIIGLNEPPLTIPKPNILTPRTQGELNAARNILKNTKGIPNDRVYKVFQGFPELRKEFPRLFEQTEKKMAKLNLVTKPKIKTPEVFKQPIMKPQNIDTTKHIVSKTTAPKVGVMGAIKTGYTKAVDSQHRLAQLDKYLTRNSGKELLPQDRAYWLSLNARGSDVISSHILESELVTATGDVIGEGLGSITKQIPKGKLSQFEDYMLHRHAPSWTAKGKNVFPESWGITPEVSQSKVAQYEQANPDFKVLAEQWDKWWADFGQSWLVDTGIMSQKTWDQWRRQYPHYIKLQRQMADVEKSRWSVGKRATGSERPIVSPIESAIEDIDHIVKLAKRNEVLQTIVRHMERDPEGMSIWGKIVKEEGIAVKEIDDMEETLTQLAQSYEQPRIDPKHGNNLIVKVDGKPVQVRINDVELLDALSNINPKAQGLLIEAARQVTRQFKNLTTGINPMFGLFRNVIRDIPMSYITSKTTNNPIKFAKDMVGSVISILKNDELYKSYKRVGGGHSSSISADRNLLAESKARILPGYINPKKPIQATKRSIGKGISTIERLNNILETAPRLGEFKRVTQQTPGYSGRVKGLYEANDVTVNFKRSGEAGRAVDAFIPYLNAAIQGMDKIGRTFIDRPVQSAGKAFLSVTVPTIALYIINRGNPDYENLNEYTKDNYFLIPRSDGTFVKLPKPRELGIMFGALPERELRQWAEADPEAFDKFSESFLGNFLPPTRTIGAPVGDIRANKDFLDRPIVSAGLERLSPKLQYDENTSEPAKALGSFLNISPKKVDYLGENYLGVLGQVGLPALTKNKNILEGLKRQVVIDPLYSNDVLNKFYEIKEKLDTAQSDFKATKEKSTGYDKRMQLAFNRTARAMSEIRKQSQRIQQNKSISLNEKEERLRANRQRMINLAQKQLDRIEGRSLTALKK